ncbi:hypothetical protein AM587_10007136 [Phytophthora nicotianae]|uniref:Uncharacterized protein n=1 Tax=Phytophthora nicotianae TaxID=4792 RepID=A0A0W8DVM0_PHYNI|nr:hypothetical protein AM587_10007136 [Phytophthora nicotianae]
MTGYLKCNVHSGAALEGINNAFSPLPVTPHQTGKPLRSNAGAKGDALDAEVPMAGEINL